MTTEDKEALGACVAPERTHRIAEVHRVTKETDVLVRLDLDGDGTADVDTCVPFLDHMLDALGRHGLLGLTVQATGDVQVDDHHTVEDVGIVLGTRRPPGARRRKGYRTLRPGRRSDGRGARAMRHRHLGTRGRPR